jgi:hypothetical protein
MPSVKALCARRCVKDLIQVVEQVPLRLAARPALVLDDSSVAALALWTLLRWERTFLLRALEDKGVDMWALTCEVDDLLNESRPEVAPADGQPAGPSAAPLQARASLDQLLEVLLDRAELEALAVQHRFLGTEHLLLAIISGADARLSSVLSRYGITHESVRAMVAELLSRAPAVEDQTILAELACGPAGARWDTEAVGVPRRFGMAILMMLVTMFAVLFAAMESLGARPIVFIPTAILFAGVALGQMLLFGGKYPRAASVWVGACLFPVEILAVLLCAIFFPSLVSTFSDTVPLLVLLLFLSIPLGAGLGYLAGGLTASAFLFIELYKRRRQDRQAT